MKSFIFCTSYINNLSRKHLWLRYKRWIDYYEKRLDDFSSDYLFLIDDGSNKRYLDKRAEILSPQNLPANLKKKIIIAHFEDNLGRQTLQNYPGWWRSFLFSYEVAMKYNFERIIHIESDFFILSERLTDYINSIQSGWTTFYSEHYQIPETALQVICKDSFKTLEPFVKKAKEAGYTFHDIAERILPFTQVEKKFYGDRFGEAQVFRKWKKEMKNENLDYIGQVKPYIALNKYTSLEN